MQGHVLLQVDWPLEGLVAQLALELLRGVHVLLVLAKALFAIKLLAANIAIVSVVRPLVSEQMLVECVPVLHFLSANTTRNPRGRHFHVIRLVRHERLFGLEGLCAGITHESVRGPFVNSPYVAN